jgi:hypothetical protein
MNVELIGLSNASRKFHILHVVSQLGPVPRDLHQASHKSTRQGQDCRMTMTLHQVFQVGVCPVPVPMVLTDDLYETTRFQAIPTLFTTTRSRPSDLDQVVTSGEPITDMRRAIVHLQRTHPDRCTIQSLRTLRRIHQRHHYRTPRDYHRRSLMDHLTRQTEHVLPRRNIRHMRHMILRGGVLVSFQADLVYQL